eukprot:6662458-Prymnesium_polylepis.1
MTYVVRDADGRYISFELIFDGSDARSAASEHPGHPWPAARRSSAVKSTFSSEGEYRVGPEVLR